MWISPEGLKASSGVLITARTPLSIHATSIGASTCISRLQSLGHKVSESSRVRVACDVSLRLVGQDRTGNGRTKSGTSLPTPGITTFYGDGKELILGGFRAALGGNGLFAGWDMYVALIFFIRYLFLGIIDNNFSLYTFLSIGGSYFVYMILLL